VSKLLWSPSAPLGDNTKIGAFMARAATNSGRRLNDYEDLHRWSIEESDDFWRLVLDYCKLEYDGDATVVVRKKLGPDKSLGGRFFPNLRLNFAENLLRRQDDHPALFAVNELGENRAITYAGLRSQVDSVWRCLREHGVSTGDRVAAIMPNIPEAVVGMLAAASEGAVFSSCSPDFGVRAVLDRFAQIAPRVLLAASGYTYKGKRFDKSLAVAEICQRLPSLELLIIFDERSNYSTIKRLPTNLNAKVLSWDEAITTTGTTPARQKFDFNHPLYILFSSGTTGAPKCIVHGAGGTLLQHAKELILHCDLGPDDTIAYYTTCGWMMWNWLVSSLFVGATVVLYDGAPSYPHLGRLFEAASVAGVTHLGTSPAYLGACRSDGLQPHSDYNLGALRVVLSTGAPLLREDFEWVYEAVGNHLLLASISGGTDIISCFMLGCPILPVVAGELQCVGLGMDVFASAPDNSSRLPTGNKGELCCRAPFPSMPIGFWNDDDTRYRAAYFGFGDQIWRHGDLVEFTGSQGETGGIIVHGRSDATLNPGGVRIGTAELYNIVEPLPEIADSIAVAGEDPQGGIRVLLFVKLTGTTQELTNELTARLKDTIAKAASRRHVPAEIYAVDDIPYTRSGKKVEVAIRELVNGRPVTNQQSIINPECLLGFSSLRLGLK